MHYTPILATLAYVLSPDRRQVLLIHRNRRPDDTHFGKYNGLGGKLNPGEDIVSCIRREVREEAGLECDNLILRGTISWPGFGNCGENWFGFIFRVDRYSGVPRVDNSEGTLKWVDVDRLLDLRACEKMGTGSGQPAQNPENSHDQPVPVPIFSQALPLWEGDRFFLPLVFEPTDRQFHGVMPYRDGRPVSWSVSFLERLK